MRNTTEKYSLTRKYLLAFCDLFLDLYVIRYDDNLSELSYQRAPLILPYSEKWYAYQRNIHLVRDNMNESALYEIARTLPAIHVGEISLNRSTENQHNKFEMLNRNSKKAYTPIPYELSITLTIMTKLLDDNFMILEQILPAFAPSKSININPLDGYQEDESIPVFLEGISSTMPFELEMENERVISTTLDFKMKVNYYPEYYDLEDVTKTLGIETE